MDDTLKPHEIPGHVTLVTGKGGLPAIRVETETSTAEIYLHGAQVTAFQKKGGAPLLFMSEASSFQPDKAIRGGVPLIFPWFGPREGMAAHGFARLAQWELTDTRLLPDASVRLHFRLPCEDEFDVEFIVTVAETLGMEFTVTNTGASDFTFEDCLHTYFQVSDVRHVSVTGLQGSRHIDCAATREHLDDQENIRFTAETDRVYQDSPATVEIHDPGLRRAIIIRKTGSLSTVVWNPWIEKAALMPDFGDDEWPHMLCVESGNVKQHAITLAPGESSSLKVEIESVPLA